ncbi:unnamed protein product [Didymodactylos carnosus]|uniref:Uncharacterized protein n=1 Tax=Didymodactylos carnosus TaxID=1234261 RepID=A0A814MI29_9BILA|nr:unnamed protein product [Didymodactylos carnosus]CAF1078238.1 unnamed protein product [Didymodactylos carnosus]CAF3657813.1 unnamed protein product [Didymodactylos carnosus]CAF3844454.1 unnamed protein product [Didymodactylos carnosus]
MFTTIEDLLSKLWHKIFEYLDGYDIYKAFDGLNSTINKIIDTISQLHFDFTNISSPNYRLIQYKFMSLKLINQNTELQLFTRLKQLSQLRSLTLTGVRCICIIEKLPQLNQLQSVFIRYSGTTSCFNIAPVLRTIFKHLPFIKHLTLLPNDYQWFCLAPKFIVPTLTNNYLNTLVIHIWTCHDLFQFVHVIPNIKRLKVIFGCSISGALTKVFRIPKLKTLYFETEKNSLQYDFIVYLFKCFYKLEQFSFITRSREIVNDQKWNNYYRPNFLIF